MDPVPVLVGAAVALALIVLGVRLRGEGGRASAGAGVIALAPVIAVFTTLFVAGQSIDVPPHQFLDWVLLAGVVAVPVGLLASRGGVASIGATALVALIAVVLFTVPTESLHERYWDGRVALYVSVLTIAVVGSFGARVAAAALGRSTEMLLASAIAMLAAAPALGLSGTGTSALLVAAVSSSAGLFGLYLVARKDVRECGAPLDRASAAPQSILFGGLLANGVLYAETPRGAGALLIAAPLVALVPGKGLPASIVRLVIVVAICATAAWLSKGEPDPYSAY